jgi:hypothetical protein
MTGEAEAKAVSKAVVRGSGWLLLNGRTRLRVWRAWPSEKDPCSPSETQRFSAVSEGGSDVDVYVTRHFDLSSYSVSYMDGDRLVNVVSVEAG